MSNIIERIYYTADENMFRLKLQGLDSLYPLDMNDDFPTAKVLAEKVKAYIYENGKEKLEDYSEYKKREEEALQLEYNRKIDYRNKMIQETLLKEFSITYNINSDEDYTKAAKYIKLARERKILEEFDTMA